MDQHEHEPEQQQPGVAHGSGRPGESAAIDAVTARLNVGLDALRDSEVAKAGILARDIRALVELAELAGTAHHLTAYEQFVDLELAGTLDLGRQAASHRLTDAQRIVTALPLTLQMLEAGTLLVHHANKVLELTHNCQVEVSRLVEQRVLPYATRLGTPDLARRINAAVLTVEAELQQADPSRDDGEARRQQAIRGRRSILRPDTDAMAIIGARVPAEQALIWSQDLDVLARQDKATDRQAGISRTADQRRADLLAALPGMVLAAREQRMLGSPAAGTPSTTGRLLINVHVPMATVLDLDHTAGQLAGYGPISADHIRALLPCAALRAIYVDQDSGRPISIGATLPPLITATGSQNGKVSRNGQKAAGPGRGGSAGRVHLVGPEQAVRERLLSMIGPVCRSTAPNPSTTRPLSWPAWWTCAMSAAAARAARPAPPGRTATTRPAGPTARPPPGT